MSQEAKTKDLIAVNGVDATTGDYVDEPWSPDDGTQAAFREEPDPHTRLTSGQLFLRSPRPATGPAEVQAASEAPVRAAEGEIDLRALRELLMAAFSAQDLARLFRYTSNAELRPAVSQFSPADGLSTLTDKVLTYCETRALLPDLLEEIKRENPRQYARFELALRRAGS